mgnify:CR=1 FL=1|jgi:hypothetical protein
MSEIILNTDQSLTEKDPDIELAKKLEQSDFWLADTVNEMKELMKDAKNHAWAEALKVRLDLIKHAQTLHWSKAAKTNMNIWIFMHPWANDKLKY